MSKTNSALMVEWGMPKDGREMKALEEFMSHMAWWTDLKAKGKITDFHTYGPLTGDFKRAGFVIVEGTDQQIEQFRTSEEFRSGLNRVMLIGNDIHVTLLECGDAMTTRMQRYGKSVKERLG